MIRIDLKMGGALLRRNAWTMQGRSGGALRSEKSLDSCLATRELGRAIGISQGLRIADERGKSEARQVVAEQE